MEKKKKLRFLNLFDIIVIAVIAVLALILIMTRDSNPVISSTPTSTVNYTIELTGLQNDSGELISVGDKLVDKIKKYNIGEVTSVEITDYVYQNYDYENGGMVESTSEIMDTAIISVTAQCVETDTLIVVDGGFVISVGASVSVKGPGYHGTGNIIAIERGDD